MALCLRPAPLVAQAPQANSVAVEALSRLKGLDLEANPSIKAAVLRVIEGTRGTSQFVDLVRDFKLKDQDPALLEYAIAHPTESAGVEAMRMVLANGSLDLIRTALAGEGAAGAIDALGNTGEKQIVPLLEPLLTDSKRDALLRNRVVHALAQVQEGAGTVLNLVRQERLPQELRLAATVELNNVRWPAIKAEAARLLPPVQSRNAEPLPPVDQLIRRQGDVRRGEDLFFSPQVGCGSCHQANGRGVDFGPKLSEIGTKLGKDALYASILDPNAGIAFGYEAWQIELKNGDEAYGLIASETADELAVKAQNGVVTRYKKSEIAKRDKQAMSVMPAGLQQTMTTSELVDLIEYLSSLKKASP